MDGKLLSVITEALEVFQSR
ncbi:hypothetical protein A2U01_0037568, partial [Trifolium medium]|nr:hypothetical protein [Trifolium medium]